MTIKTFTSVLQVINWNKVQLINLLYKRLENIGKAENAKKPGSVFTKHSLEHSLSYSPDISKFRSI